MTIGWTQTTRLRVSVVLSGVVTSWCGNKTHNLHRRFLERPNATAVLPNASASEIWPAIIGHLVSGSHNPILRGFTITIVINHVSKSWDDPPSTQMRTEFGNESDTKPVPLCFMWSFCFTFHVG